MSLEFGFLIYDNVGLPWRGMDKVAAKFERRVERGFVIEAKTVALSGEDEPVALALFLGPHRLGVQGVKFERPVPEGQEMVLSFTLGLVAPQQEKGNAPVAND